MIPSNRWFPSGLAERVAWFNQFAAQFALVAASLGFNPAAIAAVNADNAIMQFLLTADLAVKAFEEAVAKYRKAITEGDIGDPTPIFPTAPVLVFPTAVATGIFERLDKLVTKIKAADNYTETIGAELGILPSQGEDLSPSERKPTLKLEALFTGYKFNATVGNRDGLAFQIQICRANTEVWTNEAFGSKNPLEVEITPTTPGEPERIQVRAVLLENNKPVGQPSDMQYLTLNP